MKIELQGTFNEVEFKEIYEFIKSFDASKYEDNYLEKNNYDIYWYCNNGVISRVVFTKF